MLPQLILLGLILFEASVFSTFHGEPRPEPNFNIYLKLVDNAILLAILYWGGFFVASQ